MIDPVDVHELVGRWWFAYDAARFDEWPALFTDDTRFTCRTDTGATDFEEFVRADVVGRDQVLAWQRAHRLGSPHPLRHHSANVHLVDQGDESARFRSYLWVTQIVAGSPSPLSTAVVEGGARLDDGVLRLAEHVVLDTQDSMVLADTLDG